MKIEELKIDINIVSDDTSVYEWRSPYIRYLKDGFLPDDQK